MLHDRELDLPSEASDSNERVEQRSNELLAVDTPHTVIYPSENEYLPTIEMREYTGGTDSLFIELRTLEGVELLQIRGEGIATWSHGLIQTIFVCEGRELAVPVDGAREGVFQASTDPVIVQQVKQGSLSGTVFITPKVGE